MTEEKINKLNEITEMIPEVSKARTNAYTSWINAKACLDLDKLNFDLIKDFSDFIYENVSDICRFYFIYTNIE